jgi:hypothetical protein
MRDVTWPRTPADRPGLDLNRRDAIRHVAAGAVAGLAAPESLASVPRSRRPAKRVIVAGAGIGGLCCAVYSGRSDRATRGGAGTDSLLPRR